MTRKIDSNVLTGFGAAADDLWNGIRGGGALDSEVLGQVLEGLARFLRSRTVDLDEDEAWELASEAVTRLVSLRETEVRNAGAYLTVVAWHLAVDRLRAKAKVDLRPGDEIDSAAPAEDPRLAALLEASADVDEVRAGMRAAIDDGNWATARVVAAWLDLASELGHAPSSRAVGSRAGVSHTTVNALLRRFRAYLPSQGT
jgi:DNA-directed RNA polymerase specialized sigma24 family protein